MASPNTATAAPTKTDVRRLKSEAKHKQAFSDKNRTEAYERGRGHGQRGTEPERPFDDELAEYYDAGHEEGTKEREKRRSEEAAKKGPEKSRSDRPPAGSGQGTSGARTPARASAGVPKTVTRVGEQGASFVLGGIAYALVVSYLRYGWGGVTGWLSAKFTNKVTVNPNATPPGQPGAGQLGGQLV